MITIGDSELPKLKRAVDSAKKYVQSVHITANGDEVEKTKKWCEENGFDYSYLKWNDDFSQQRNFNFSRAPRDVDYIFWMDSDDILVGGEHLVSIAEGAKLRKLDCVYLTYWYSCVFDCPDGEETLENLIDIDVEHQRERLINPQKMLWRKRCHETPVQIEGIIFNHGNSPYDEKKNPIAIMHTGSKRGESMKNINARNDRNRRLLELELEDERLTLGADPRTILYLMKIYTELNDSKLHEKNFELGAEYLSLSGWDVERATCNLLMARSAAYFNEWEASYRYIYQAMNEYPRRIETYLRLAEACFMLKKYSDMEHWLKVAASFDEDKDVSKIDNITLNKTLAAELTTRYFWKVRRNIRKAYTASKDAAELNPTEENKNRSETLRQLANLDMACEHVDKLCKYLIMEKEKKAVLDLLRCLPQAIQLQPFALNYMKKYQPAKIWGKNEICYYANFGTNAFEEWSPKKLESGLGGSETAVVELAKRWARNGYQVTVYGDPGEYQGVHDGVLYVPWYYFNPKDKFNIFIQWRDGSLSDQISAKKFYVDLHDVWNSTPYLDRVNQIDGLFVKSEAHKRMAKGIPESKLKVISNGTTIYEI